MTSRKLAAVLALAFATSGAGAFSRHDADVLVALGAGVAGTWETEFEFANPDDANAVNVFAGEQPHPFVCVTSPCGIAYAPLPRTGSARIVTRSVDFGTFTGRLFVGADDAEELPTVKARVVNRARPSQGIELPLYRRSTLVALNPLVLSFPGVERSAASHTNLFVSEIGLSAGIDVLIEAYASSGERLGQEARSLTAGETLFLQDVLPLLNAAELSEGQIRLTRTNGGGVMWGLAATVFDDGHVTVTAGKHP
jgi:hypothetical protein